MTKRMICYRRVSTDDQADKGYSLPSQLEAIKAYAAQHGYAIVADFADDYSGATPIAERPEGKKAIAMLKRKEADGIITHHVDRLSRDLVDALATVRDLTRAGLEVHTLDIGRIDAETDIVLVIKAWQGSDERKKIIERTSRGRKQKAKNGLVVGHGWPLYGYRFTNNGSKTDGFKIHEPEAAVVRNIFRWYVTGDERKKPLTVYEITLKLSMAGIPTPVESQGRTTPRKRGTGLWNHTTVDRIIANETYAGVHHYGKAGTFHKGITKMRALSETIAVGVPSIIDHSLWEAAQQRLELNKSQSRRNAKHEYLLTSLIKCSCGHSMTGATKQTWRYYRCGAHSTKLTGLEDICHQTVDAGRLEQAAWSFIVDVITQRDQFSQWLREAQAAELEALQPRRDELENIEALIATAEQEAGELATAMKHARGLVSRKLEAQADEVDQRYNKLIESRDRIQMELDAAEITDESITDFVQFAETVIEGLNDPTFEQKRRWLGYLKVKINIADKVATISCRFPVKPAIIDLRSSKIM